MSENHDYTNYAKSDMVDQGDKLHRLVELGRRQIKAEKIVEECEAALDKAKKELANLAENIIPELMETELGVESIGLDNGLKLKIKKSIKASIPKGRLPDTMRWLRDNRHGKLIKRIISFNFGKGEDKRAGELLETIGEEFEYEDKESVHNSTLTAFVREKLDKGEELPAELFSVFTRKVSTITASK